MELPKIHKLLETSAQVYPDATLLYTDASVCLSYADVWKRVQVLANDLKSQGVQSGHRVMIVGENSADMVIALFACSLIESLSVSVNARLSPREINAIHHHCEPALTLYMTANSSDALSHATQAGAILSKTPAWFESVQQCIYPNTSPESAEVYQKTAALVYTSGTTGAPKGVMVSHLGLTHFAKISSASRRLSPSDICYGSLPLSHIFGLATVLLSSVYAGASLFLRRQFNPQEALDAFVTPGITMFQGVPMMYTRLLQALGDTPHVYAPHLRYIYTGGAALDPSLKVRVESVFGRPLHHGYGITEYAGSMCVTRMDEPSQDCTAGYPVEGVRIHIGDLDQPCHAPGVAGDIYISGPGLMLGYYHDPEQTSMTLLNREWLKTGDIGYLSAAGALYLVGRSKDLIIRSGFNVYPLEVEAVINTFPGVRVSAVVGKETEDKNEEVIAFIETQNNQTIDLQALSVFLSNELAPYKRPSAFIMIDRIPTTLSGKIQKQPLREEVSRRTQGVPWSQ